MSDVKPILFSGPMVRALLDGRKTQTRRVLKVNIGPLPYKTGDLLWVREKAYYGPNMVAYAADNVPIGRRDRVEGWGPARSSIHMPRWASRITLIVTDVRVQRLQEISADDALAEGVIRQDPTPEDEAWNRQWCEGEGIEADPLEPVWLAPGTRQGFGSRPNDPQWGPTPEFAFRLLWDSINASRGFGWDTNPWVCAISFIVHQMNVDAFLAQREDTKEISSSSSSRGGQR